MLSQPETVSNDISFQDDIHSIEEDLGGGGADVGRGGPSRVPTPVTPHLPVSQHVDKIFKEKATGGFAKNSRQKG